MPEATSSSATADIDERGISVLDLLTILGEQKTILLGVPALAVIGTIMYSLTLPPIFTAKTVMMLPQQAQSSTSNVLAGIGALTGASSSAFSIKSSEELYMSLLATESLQNSLIERLNLKAHYNVTTLLDARKSLSGSLKVTIDKKSGLITAEVDDKDPVFAAQLANAHVDELRKLLGRLAVTEAQQRRAFFEQHIVKTREALTAAELRFRQAKEKTGMQPTLGLVQESVGGSAALRTQIATREVQLQSMRAFATPENPEARRIASELAALREQLERFERGSGAVQSASLQGQQAVDAYRDVKVQEAILEGDMRQLELARADEAREGPLIQQIDVASVPSQRSKPNRRQMVTLAAFVGVVLGIVLAFVAAGLRRAAKRPGTSERMAELRRAWSLRPWRGRVPRR